VLYDKDHGSPKIHFGFRVNTPRQVEEWRFWLKKKKVRILEDVKEHDFRSIKFRDPDGHTIEISQER
jgi:catechol 2,3-dioxygenase-like lactoylglutathione lyase family enzyme